MITGLSILCLVLAVVAIKLGLVLRSTCQERKEDAKRYEQSLRDSRDAQSAGHERILNALNDALLLVSPAGIILFANSQARALFQDREILGRHIEEVFLDDRLADPVRSTLKDGTNVTRQVNLSQQASPLGISDLRGETSWIIDAGPLNHDHPKEGLRIIIRDHTDQHQTEQVRQDFVANASHELRTPLAIINGYIENLLDDEIRNDPEIARRFLGTMQKHGSRIGRIVEDMLVISRLESGEAAALKPEPFDFPECVIDVIDRLESVTTNQNSDIRTGFPEDGLAVIGDRFYWTQVMFNLIENALKQNANSPITIEVGCRRTESGEIAIWVADNGIGIPGADLPFIFRRFYRVEKHHSQGQIKGTGLGLSIVRRAVEAHGGTIEVSSTPGRSTRFDITLPASALATEALEDATAVQEPS